MRTLLKSLCLAALLAAPVAAEPARRNALPNPLQYLEPDCVAWGTLIARPEDKGFQSLLRTAWKALQEKPNSGAAWMSMLMAVLSQSTQEDVLISLLPFEGTRVDRLDEKGEDHSATIVTLSGLTGFQGLFWNSLLNGPDGKPLPTQSVAGETLVLHPKAGQDSLMGLVTARIKGSFLAFSDLKTAQRTLAPHQPSGEVYDIASSLDLSQDTVGVLLNRKNSLMRFMTWLDGYDMHVIGDAVGQKRFKDDMDTVEYVTWTGDLVDDDKMELAIAFHTKGEKEAEELELMLTITRRALKDMQRAADVQMTTVGKDVNVRVQMTGHRQLLLNFLQAKK